MAIRITGRSGFALVLSLFLTLMTSPSTAIAKGVLAWCPKFFARLGVYTPPNPLLALRADFPGIEDPAQFALRVRDRSVEWNRRNPRNRGNFSMPEHAPGVEWLKDSLTTYKQDPYFAGRQRGAEIQALHDARVSDFLLRIESLKRRKFPHHDTLELAHDVSVFFGELDSVFSVSAITGTIADRISRLRPMKNLEKLDGLFEAARMSVGPKRVAAQKEYDEALTKFIAEWLESTGVRVDAATEYRNAELDLTRTIALTKKLSKKESDARSIQNSAMILSPGVATVRGTAEAALFDIHPAGLALKAERVDGEITLSDAFMVHDFGHFSGAEFDSYTQAVMRLSKAKKMRILNSIDLLKEPREKALAEFALLAVLRENLGSMFRFRSNDAGKISDIQNTYFTVMREKLSESEATWMLQWLEKNINVRVEAF